MPWKPVPRPGGLRAPAELGAPVPGAALWEGGEQASGRAGWTKAAIAVQRGPRARPSDSEQAGSRQRAAGRRAGGGPGCSRGHGHGRSSLSQAAEGSTAAPAAQPTVQRRERLLLFGEEAESLLLVFLAEAGIRAGDGGQGQALSLDADALGLVDGGAHTLKPGQHLLLQSGRVRTLHLPGPCEGWGLVPQECPFCRSLEGKCLGSPLPAPLLAGVWAKLPCTYLILAMEEPFAAIAQPRKTEGFLPCSHLWSPLPGQRAGSDPTVPSQAAHHLLREVKIWTISLPGFKNP